jgi:transcriptional regulator with XRE-family HTH domain
MARRTTDDKKSEYSREYARALGHTVKVIRTDRGMGRSELAQRAGISYSYLTEIENGNKPPSPTVLEPLGRALGLRMSELVEAAEARMAARSAVLAEEEAAGRMRLGAPSKRLFSTADYAMQPSLRSRRDLRAVVIELERLLQDMAPDDVERLLDYAHRLVR